MIRERQTASKVAIPRRTFLLIILIIVFSTISFFAGHEAGFMKATMRAIAIDSASGKKSVRVNPVAVEQIESKNDDHGLTTNTEINENFNYLWNGEEIFEEAALSMKPVTDKVTTHDYQIMYGKFLLPYYYQNPRMKMLEIGLGCDMDYGPGASVAVYKKLFPKAELWEAEFNAECVEKHRGGMLEGINVLVGDQGNDAILDEWIEKSGGNFDVVIDDGGHQNCQIWHSFQKLWPTVKPGGLYFIEDMQVAQWDRYQNYTTSTCDETLIVPEKLKGFIDDLIYDVKARQEIKFIYCQTEACVLGKEEEGKGEDR